MVHTPLALLSLVGLPTALAAGLYPKSSGVLQVDGTSYQKLIADSNHTSIVEFYAPWCGHCKNLQPEYEKAAQKLKGLAKVAAVNCDEEMNKPFCGKMGIQGFPTLKIVKAGKKAGKPVVEDYQGERKAKAIVSYVLDKIPNKVKRLKDDEYSDWLEKGDKPKAILFTNKGTVSPLLKAVAIDFLDAIDVAQIRDKEKGAVDTFAVDKFPTLVLVPSNGATPIKYEGELDKAAIVDFLSQASAPNPDGAPKAKKATDSKNSNGPSKKSKKVKKDAPKASDGECPYKPTDAKASQAAETLEDPDQPTESPSPEVDSEKPIKLPEIATPIASLDQKEDLQRKCLNSKAGTCILALTPETTSDSAKEAISELSELHAKYERSGHILFPFYELLPTNPYVNTLRSKLSLSPEEVQIIAVNAKRNWFAQYAGASYTRVKLEEWVDAIRMGDVKKTPLAEELVVDAADLPAEPSTVPKIKLESAEEALKVKLGDGIDFDAQDLTEEDYQRIIAQAKAASKAKQDEAADHDEL